MIVKNFVNLRVFVTSCLLLVSACGEEKGRIAGVGFHNDIKTRDPQILLSLIASTTTPDDSRLQADKIYKEIADPKSDARLAVLEQMFFAPGHSDAMRIHAIDELAAADPNRCARAFINYLPRLEENAGLDVLKHACTIAIKLQDPRLLAPLARSASNAVENTNAWSNRAALRELPELDALAQLADRPLADALLHVISTSREGAPRIAAFNLLQIDHPALPRTWSDRTQRVQDLSDLFQKRIPYDVFCNNLRTYFGLFKDLPKGETEHAWVRTVLSSENLASTQQAAQTWPKQSTLREPRFIHAIQYGAARGAGKDFNAYADHIASLLKPLATTPREAAHAVDVPNSTGLPADRKHITFEDLLTIDLLLTAFQNPATINEFHRLGLEDMSDTTTEHGGLLSLKNPDKPDAVIAPYKPQFTDSDQRYAVSDDLLRDAIKGLALYHFHFHKIHNAALAGPGAGDMAFARKTRTNHIVITSVGPRQINIDYYTPNGLVVDLGTYTAKE